MDNQKLPPEIMERFKQLPPVVQESLMESNWEDETRKIVSKYNLRVDQGAYVETETMLIMFGFIPPSNFIPDIVKDMKIDQEIATQIEYEISQKIFKRVMDIVKEKTEKSDSKFTSSATTNGGEDVSKPQVPEFEDPIISNKLNNTSVEKPKRFDPYLEPIE